MGKEARRRAREKMERGIVFGRLTLVERDAERSSRREYWKCHCACGAALSVRTDSLRIGATQSCGCLNVDRHFKHGQSRSPEWEAWHSLRSRCENPRLAGYAAYGGRGIRVCVRWSGKHGFENFLADVGRRPSPSHSIDRFPDNDGNYEPGNVRWATAAEQATNRRNTVRITIDGETKTLVEWVRLYSQDLELVRQRIDRRGWVPHLALITPRQSRSEAARAGWKGRVHG